MSLDRAGNNMQKEVQHRGYTLEINKLAEMQSILYRKIVQVMTQSIAKIFFDILPSKIFDDLIKIQPIRAETVISSETVLFLGQETIKSTNSTGLIKQHYAH